MRINRFAVHLRGRLRKTDTLVSKPNTSEGWELRYVQKSAPSPIKVAKSEISGILNTLTRPGESLLETGCGSGALSAELALLGRKISVCDFSQPILDRVKLLFQVSGLNTPETYLVDITRRMPFSDNQFDVVWSSGVLEHWVDEEIVPIVRESARCARRCVISLVPNERSLLYRYGREYAEANGIAPWGRELPRQSLRNAFEQAGLKNVTERTCCLSDAPRLIYATDPVFAEKLCHWWDSLRDDDPVKQNQGYLLLTVGYKQN
jgi:SAM-dependent methyltransferase